MQLFTFEQYGQKHSFPQVCRRKYVVNAFALLNMFSVLAINLLKLLLRHDSSWPERVKMTVEDNMQWFKLYYK